MGRRRGREVLGTFESASFFGFKHWSSGLELFCFISFFVAFSFLFTVFFLFLSVRVFSFLFRRFLFFLIPAVPFVLGTKTNHQHQKSGGEAAPPERRRKQHQTRGGGESSKEEEEEEDPPNYFTLHYFEIVFDSFSFATCYANTVKKKENGSTTQEGKQHHTHEGWENSTTPALAERGGATHKEKAEATFTFTVTFTFTLL